MTSPTADLMIRIKNGYMARREHITTPISKLRVAILEKLKSLGYIEDFIIAKEDRLITIILKYEDSVAAMTDVKLFSKPGRRWYIAQNEIPRVRGGMGCAIISTSKGIMTDNEARKENLGGELIFSIW